MKERKNIESKNKLRFIILFGITSPFIDQLKVDLSLKIDLSGIFRLK
jgi:hypothetical protein